MKKVLSFFILMLLPMVAEAYDAKIDGIYYIFNKTKKTAEVTYRYSSSNQNTYSGSVNIPPSVNYDGETYDVTSIGNSAFHGCSSLTSVTIGNSVTSIGYEAFRGCSGLTSVTIPNSVTSIWAAFEGCSGLTSVHISDISAWCKISFSDPYSNPLYYAHHLYLGEEEIKDLIIPNIVKSIGSYAFRDCSGFTSVTIPNSVTSIGYEAFRGCSGLTSVTIPNSVTGIGNYAFQNCRRLTSVTIPNSVTIIGGSAFGDCSGLISITIPNSVTVIGKYAFQNCSNLTSITIPNCVTWIGERTFYGCKGMTSITIGNSVTSIDKSAFEGCSGLTSVTIPNSVTSIGQQAFYGCSSLSSVIIPNSVTSIGRAAFSNCTSLTSIMIPDWWTSIGESIFSGCSSLTSFSIPNSVTSIENYAFARCSGLTSVTIPKSVTSIGSEVFRDCTSLMTVKSFIERPYDIDKFPDKTYLHGILYVPKGTKELYVRFDGWREFLKIEEIENEPAPNGQCATPNIMIAGKAFKFSCETPGAEFESILTTEEHFTGNELPMENREIVYTLTVYATAPGYDRSEPAKLCFTVDRTDVNQDGSIDVADIATIINRMAGK